MGLNRFLFVARWKQRILDVLLSAGEIDPNSRRWVLNFSYISILMAEAATDLGAVLEAMKDENVVAAIFEANGFPAPA